MLCMFLRRTCSSKAVSGTRRFEITRNRAMIGVCAVGGLLGYGVGYWCQNKNFGLSRKTPGKQASIQVNFNLDGNIDLSQKIKVTYIDRVSSQQQQSILKQVKYQKQEKILDPINSCNFDTFKQMPGTTIYGDAAVENYIAAVSTSDGFTNDIAHVCTLVYQGLSDIDISKNRMGQWVCVQAKICDNSRLQSISEIVVTYYASEEDLLKGKPNDAIGLTHAYWNCRGFETGYEATLAMMESIAG